MLDACVVDLGGWDEKYVFTNMKDALSFYEAVKKAKRATSEYQDEYLYVEKTQNKISITEGKFFTKAEYDAKYPKEVAV